MREVGLVAWAWAIAVSTTAAQQLDTLPPVIVSVTRADLPLTRLPFAVAVVDKQDFGRGRPTWGLDEALAGVPGVPAANRYNFSLDQRLAIRGFGSRSAFAAVQNLFNRKYVGSVVLNAGGGRYYEPAPGLNVLLGLMVGAGS